MKKAVLWLLLATVVCSLVPFSAAAEDVTKDATYETTYIVPHRSDPPKIDGNGDDNAWFNAVEIFLSSKTATTEGGWTSSYTEDGAEALISIVWSGTEGKQGVYIKWTVMDSTPSIGAVYNTAQINTQDCVQVILDPMYKRFTSVMQSALCFSFAPYAATAQGSYNISHRPFWWEHWHWQAGMIQAIGCKTASSLLYNDEKDLVGYVLEAFIPFKAMSIYGVYPKSITPYETTIGIGLALIDYEIDIDATSLQEARQFISLSTDFGTSEESIKNPSQYCTLLFGDELNRGSIVRTKETDTPSAGDSIETDRIRLEQVINSVSNLDQNDFTSESWAYMIEKYSLARILASKETATQKMIDDAVNELTLALKRLERKDTAAETTVVSSQVTGAILNAAISMTALLAFVGLMIAVLSLRRGQKEEKTRD